MDLLKEAKRAEGEKIGTTGRGIGPAYCDKATRSGIRAYELLDLDLFKARFITECKKYNENKGNLPLIKRCFTGK